MDGGVLAGELMFTVRDTLTVTFIKHTISGVVRCWGMCLGLVKSNDVTSQRSIISYNLRV